MSKLDKDAVIAKFTEAYTSAHGKAPTIEAKGGWYSVDGGKNVRLAALDEQADALSANDVQVDTAATETVVAPKAAKKAPAKKAAPTSSSGFSVKEFWNTQVLGKQPGSKAPR